MTAPSSLKYQQVSQVLAERIRQGAYDESGLPGERELAAEFDVARVTVRHALHSLQDLGLVMRKERRGTLAVSSKGAPRPRRLLRALVDQFLDRGRVDQRRVVTIGFVGASDKVAEALEIQPGARVLRVVRVRSVGSRKLTFTEAFAPEAIGLMVTREALERKPYVQVLESLGVVIGDAEQTFSAEAAPTEVAEALGLATGVPILKMYRVLYDASGTPVQLLIGWYRSDQFDIAMRMSRDDDATRVWVRVR